MRVALPEAPAWLVSLIEKPRYESQAPPVVTTTAAERIARRLRDADLGIGSQEKFAANVLERAAEDVRRAPEGERNHTLNRVAFDQFALVKGGRLDRDAVTATLTAAAQQAGLKGKEIEATLGSAWDSAEAKTGAPLRGPQDAPGARLGTVVAITREPAPTEAGEGDTEAPNDLFRLWTPGELMAADQEFAWVLRGMLVDPTYGMIGGERKTLKSYVGTFLDLAIASGEPLFGKFTVDSPGPVVAYVGEGGRIPYTRRLVRIAEAMGIAPGDLADVPIRPSFDVAPVGSARFYESMTRELDAGCRLLHIDPYYAFHGTTANASNLFEEGSLLTALSAPCMEAGTNLLINNHFNKTGTGTGLSRITQSGAQEWCDTWILLGHRAAAEANVETGEFHLSLEIGSRQWGGTTWDLDLTIGRFDSDTGAFDGAISYDLRRAAGGAVTTPRTPEYAAQLVSEMPGQYIKEQVARLLGGRAEDARVIVNRAESEGLIRMASVVKPGSEDGTERWRRLVPGPKSIVRRDD